MVIGRIIKAILTKPFNILKGIYYNLFNKHEDLAIKRLNICKECQHDIIYKSQHICDECGCILNNKCRVDNEKCELGKW